MPSLLEFRSNTYSQNGEDGVLREVIRRLSVSHELANWCVEFGAWDGKHLSNTYCLVEALKWQAIYIEEDPDKLKDLVITAEATPGIVPVGSRVSERRDSGLTLDQILVKTPLPSSYGLLSIDIDSFDLDVWTTHELFRPTIVVIEINSALPPGILQWHGKPGAQGNSFSATLEVARGKGYTLVCHTGNLIFVDDQVADAVGLDPLDRAHPERLFLWDWVAGDREGRVSTARRIVHRVRQRVKREVQRRGGSRANIG